MKHAIRSVMTGHIELCERSLIETGDGELLLFRCDGNRFLAVRGDLANRFGGRVFPGIKIGLPDHENRLVLNEVLAWTKPVAFGGTCASFGFGDGIGYANPPQLKAIQGTTVRPVLAQQSVRKLRFAGRALSDVIDTAAWGALEEGYRDGFAADADQLHTVEEVQYAVDAGCTMVTIDYHRAGQAAGQRPEDVICAMNETWIAPAGRPIDVEISTCDVPEITGPEKHRAIADELTARGVRISSFAPKLLQEQALCEEYDGDLEALRQSIREHAQIAREFGYRLSLHRASCKFRELRILAEETKGNYHVKTTSAAWLEALKCIAALEPVLYREIHETALNHFPEISAHYRDIACDVRNIKPLQETADEELKGYFDKKDARRLLSMAYEPVLADPELKGRIQKFLQDERPVYAANIEILYKKHIRSLLD